MIKKNEPLAFFEDKEKEIEDANQYIKDKDKLERYIKTIKSTWIVSLDFEFEAEFEAELEHNSMQLPALLDL